jgi:hypothetical protein
MLCRQNLLPLLKFLRLLSQVRGTLQLTLADLLDVNLIRPLNGLCQYNRQSIRIGNTYISETESTQASPSLSQELILGHAFRSKSLNGSVDDLKGH